ncbi:MAG: polymer-forming cytoskeletal protein [Gammaproteobacteria bacterium]|jgi:cytoskeletal protein CcmA (bactofilin family)
MALFRRRIEDSAEGPATYIAASARFAGNLGGAGTFVVCGEVEGDCDIRGPVKLAKGGRWTGTLRADNVVVAGTVEGDVIAREKVEIGQSARVSGSISGSSIAVAEGAIIEGELSVTSGGEATRFTEKRSEPAD